MRTIVPVLLTMTATAAAAAPRVDLVLTGATVHTLDPQDRVAEAVAIAGNRIIAVGTSAELRRLAGRRTEVLDLAGATIIPGFQDSHCHVVGLGLSRQSVDLRGARDFEDVVALVSEAAAKRPEGEWVLGRGWHEEKWASPPVGAVRGFPTHAPLSQAIPDHPVVLTRSDGHAVLVNARAMSLRGVTAQTKPPSGGEIVLDENGELTGLFVDNALPLVAPPEPTPEQIRAALDLAMDEALAKGLTSMTDAGIDDRTTSVYREYASSGKLRVRVHAMAAGIETARLWRKPMRGFGNGFLALRSIKIYADGALGSRGAALLEPYTDDPGNRGLLVSSERSILDAARWALPRGFQLCAHAIGDRANRVVLDAYEEAFRAFPGVRDHRFRIEHAQVLDAADIPRFARLGVIAAMQGIHCPSDRPWAVERLGAERVAEGAYAWRRLLDTGARIANGTDAPVEDLSPLGCFHASVTRQSPSGEPVGGFDPEQRMTREEALRSYTRDAAWASFDEARTGTIEPGKLADLTVLSEDILTVPEERLLGTEVLLTIVDGRIAYRKGGAGRETRLAKRRHAPGTPAGN